MPTERSFLVFFVVSTAIILYYFVISFMDPGYLPRVKDRCKLLELIEKAAMDNICTDCNVS